MILGSRLRQVTSPPWVSVSSLIKWLAGGGNSHLSKVVEWCMERPLSRGHTANDWTVVQCLLQARHPELSLLSAVLKQ